MNWPAFFSSLGDFIIRVGPWTVGMLAVPVLVWKALDSWGKRGGKKR